MANEFIDNVVVNADDKAVIIGSTKRFAIAYSSDQDALVIVDTTGETPSILLQLEDDGTLTIDGNVNITGDLYVEGDTT
jgi:hypothetical protein